MSVRLARHAAAVSRVVLPAQISIGYTSVIQATFNLKSDGTWSTNDPVPQTGTWMRSGSGANYEAVATIISGGPISGSATGTPLALSSNLSWWKTQPASGTREAKLSVEIRDATTHATLATSQVWLLSDSGV